VGHSCLVPNNTREHRRQRPTCLVERRRLLDGSTEPIPPLPTEPVLLLRGVGLPKLPRSQLNRAYSTALQFSYCVFAIGPAAAQHDEFSSPAGKSMSVSSEGRLAPVRRYHVFLVSDIMNGRHLEYMPTRLIDELSIENSRDWLSRVLEMIPVRGTLDYRCVLTTRGLTDAEGALGVFYRLSCRETPAAASALRAP
jgi:hypothetical protein